VLGGDYNYHSTDVRPPFDAHSTAVPPRYDRSTTYVTTGLLHCGLTAAVAAYVAVTLMNSDKQSNGRRTEIESRSNRSCNRRVSCFYAVGIRIRNSRGSMFEAVDFIPAILGSIRLSPVPPTGGTRKGVQLLQVPLHTCELPSLVTRQCATLKRPQSEFDAECLQPVN